MKIQPAQDPVSARPPESAALPSEHSILHLQRTIGNRAVTRMLRPASTKPVQATNVNGRVQRKLIDGNTQEEFWAFAPDNMDNETHTRLVASLVNYATLMQRNTSSLAGRDDQEKGATFYAEVDAQLKIIANTSRNFLTKHTPHESFPNWLKRQVARNTPTEIRDATDWVKVLVERDIPETRSLAQWVQDNMASYPNSTYQDAITAANTDPKRKLMLYVKREYGAGREGGQDTWRDMTDAMKRLLTENRDLDAARVAAIRHDAQTMMDEGTAPRVVLQFMADGARGFLEDVINDFVRVAGLEQSDLALVGTGSSGGGELFPYSDMDVQIMTSDNGAGALSQKQLQFILHNIRMRVRLANMQEESGGEWRITMGWDVDNLVGAMEDNKPIPRTPADVREKDDPRGLVRPGPLFHTEGGSNLAGELNEIYAGARKADAKEKMRELRQGTLGGWILKNPDKLDNGPQFNFKEKFMRLPKIYLNVLAMWYGLESLNSWARIDKLEVDKHLSNEEADNFRRYLNIVSGIRIKYQFWYQQEGLDMVTPIPGEKPLAPLQYPKGLYTLTDSDRGALKDAQGRQQMLVESINRLKNQMYES